LNEEQDPAAVEKVHSKFAGILMTGEDVRYIAVQKKPVINVSPDCVIVTNKRLVICRPRLLGGFDFEDHLWREVGDVHLEEGIIGGTLTIKTVGGKTIVVDYLPKAQARKTYSLAQEMEELVHEERRQRDLEDKRAAAGGVFLPNQGDKPAKDDPMQVLSKLKNLLDAGLITQEEYDKKKSEVLARM
jgi:hypothetical protein